MKIYQRLAQEIARLDRLSQRDFGAPGMYDQCEEGIEKLVKDKFPSGSGFDKGTELDADRSTGEKLVFKVSYHHMDDHGGYCGWTEHEVIVTPSLCFGYKLRVTGRDKRQIKEYIAEVFTQVLDEEYAA